MLPAQNHRIRIALAEDDADFRKALTRLLAVLGHEVVYEASNGQELLDQLQEERVDLVIVDLDMPVVDGLEVADHLAQRGVPVILVSGHPDAERLRLEHEPVAASLLKPVTHEALQSAIERAMCPPTVDD